MAGRGTDIVLGGKFDGEEKNKQKWQEQNKSIIKAGGLHVIGAERNESRRVDNQLRGRSGRQGDPGSSRFYLSLEDDLMRIFASDKISYLMSKLGLEENEAIEHNMITSSIENAQKKVENHNFETRKNLLEYDNISNEQRKIIYHQRNELLLSDNLNNFIKKLRKKTISYLVDSYLSNENNFQENISELEIVLKSDYNVNILIDENETTEIIKQKIIDNLTNRYEDKKYLVNSKDINRFEKMLVLDTLDKLWQEHLNSMDYLRNSINLRGYAQKQPIQEYKKEAYDMFNELLDTIDTDVIKIISNINIGSNEQINSYEENNKKAEHQYITNQSEKEVKKTSTYVRKNAKVGRNQPCHCGSGKKYKNCHGR